MSGEGGLSVPGSLAAAGDFPQAVGYESDHHGVDAYAFLAGSFLQIAVDAAGQTGHKASGFFRFDLAHFSLAAIQAFSASAALRRASSGGSPSYMQPRRSGKEASQPPPSSSVSGRSSTLFFGAFIVRLLYACGQSQEFHNDMTASIMQPFNAQAVSNALNILNSPVSRVLPHLLQSLVRSCHEAFRCKDDTTCSVVVNALPISRTYAIHNGT